MKHVVNPYVVNSPKYIHINEEPEERDRMGHIHGSSQIHRQQVQHPQQAHRHAE